MGIESNNYAGRSPRPESTGSSAASPARLLPDAPVPPAGLLLVEARRGEAVTERNGEAK